MRIPFFQLSCSWWCSPYYCHDYYNARDHVFMLESVPMKLLPRKSREWGKNHTEEAHTNMNTSISITHCLLDLSILLESWCLLSIIYMLYRKFDRHFTSIDTDLSEVLKKVSLCFKILTVWQRSHFWKLTNLKVLKLTWNKKKINSYHQWKLWYFVTCIICLAWEAIYFNNQAN